VCRRNWKKIILLGLAFCVGGPAVAAKIGPEAPTVTVAIHDHVGVSAEALAEAERTAKDIFRDVGLSVELVECEPAEKAQIEQACRRTQFPSHLQLTIAERSTSLVDSILGVAYVDENGTGCYSDVFFEPTEEVHEQAYVRVGVLLGHVMAHEIAHLLLGTNSHSATGIMRAHWSSQDLEKASKHALLFTEAQGRRMRAKVEESLCVREKGLVVAKFGTVRID
jgi:hypothetical protein